MLRLRALSLQLLFVERRAIVMSYLNRVHVLLGRAKLDSLALLIRCAELQRLVSSECARRRLVQLVTTGRSNRGIVLDDAAEHARRRHAYEARLPRRLLFNVRHLHRAAARRLQDKLLLRHIRRNRVNDSPAVRLNVMHERPGWAQVLARLLGGGCHLLLVGCLLTLYLLDQLLDLSDVIVELAVLSCDERQLCVKLIDTLPPWRLLDEAGHL